VTSVYKIIGELSVRMQGATASMVPTGLLQN